MSDPCRRRRLRGFAFGQPEVATLLPPAQTGYNLGNHPAVGVTALSDTDFGRMYVRYKTRKIM
jgi:hypothetical protein